MRKIAALALFSLTAQYTAAQSSPSGFQAQQNVNALGGSGGGIVQPYDNRYAGLQGSPYLYNVWLKGSMKGKGGEYKDILLKYDTYFDELTTIRMPQQDSSIIIKAQVEEFNLQMPNNQMRRFKKLEIPNKPIGYYEIIYEGKSMVLIKWAKKLLKADFQGAYSAGIRHDELVEENKWWLRKPDGVMIEYRKNKKSLLSAYPAQATAIEAFLKKEKLNLSEPADIQKVMQFIDAEVR